MGTTYSIKFAENEQYPVNIIQAKIDSTLYEINQQMSTYIDDSEITLFNQLNAYEKFVISQEFADVIQMSQVIHKYSNGAFDPTIHNLVKLWGFGNQESSFEPPTQSEIEDVLKTVGMQNIQLFSRGIRKLSNEVELDLSAIAKGYGVDVVFENLVSLGLTQLMVEIGGEVRCSEKSVNHSTWKIGIQNPILDNSESIIEIINLSDMSMATSGSYNNNFEYDGKLYSHTINPKTGYPIDNNIVSVTIIAPLCALADGLATALSVMDVEDGLQLINSIDNIECCMYKYKDGLERFESNGFNQYLSN
jgi:FAD:protein FMN transferase